MYLRTLFAAVISALCFGQATFGQSSPFGNGWVLAGDASSLQFQSIKNGSKIETSSFAGVSGAIDPDGNASLKVLLDAVDTKVDLRNVRMRFLFFETFQYPEANITTRISATDIADLETVRRKTIRLPFTIDLHGVTKTLEADLAITLIGDDLVAVSTSEPINLAVADFNLMDGLRKLEEAANVTIVPSSSVNFDLIFRKSADDAVITTAAVTAPAAAPATAALETKGDFSLEACVGRFEILSRTGNIYFQPGSSQLASDSTPLLNSVADIVARCPDLTIQVAGHTDSIGSSAANQRLSERRAASVVSYLAQKGISAGRMISVGMGEEQPVASNDTNEGRSRNRRIEFSVPRT
ncbi:MAG: OmpA family protein [Pseudomonadota bacterium]